jgi:hypothetical protein
MKNFIEWFIVNSFFHILVLLGGIIYMLTWEPCLDKIVGISFFGLVLSILTIGKFNYWRKNVKNNE